MDTRYKLHCSAFTLVEVAIATVIVGLAVTATVMMMGYCARERSQVDDQTIGLYIATSTLEAFKPIPYNNLMSLNNMTFQVGGTTKVTISGQPDIPVTCMDRYRQVVTAQRVKVNQPTVAPSDQTTDTGAIRVTVRVDKQVGAAWRTIYSHSSYSFSG